MNKVHLFINFVSACGSVLQPIGKTDFFSRFKVKQRKWNDEKASCPMKSLAVLLVCIFAMLLTGCADIVYDPNTNTYHAVPPNMDYDPVTGQNVQRTSQ